MKKVNYIIVLLFLSSCASFLDVKTKNEKYSCSDVKNDILITSSTIFKNIFRKKDFKFSTKSNGDISPWQKYYYYGFKEHLLNTIPEDKLFLNPEDIRGKKGRKFKLEFSYNSNSGFWTDLWQWSSLLSLGVIPFSNKSEITLQVIELNEKGRGVKKWKFEEKYRNIISPFILPLMPFYSQKNADDASREKLINNFTQNVICKGI